jgi:hypothetical protein
MVWGKEKLEQSNVSLCEGNHKRRVKRMETKPNWEQEAE